MNTDIKQKIKEAIRQFNHGNLSENALNLFQILGYNTERRAPLVKDWKYVDLLFQLSKVQLYNLTIINHVCKVPVITL
ncbi:MAG: hypothetical protein ACUBOA_08740 [Candidatus Loosdrechtia sp.]|uniref:hypothetical protein n=1 Tax=Candidatus Loosdrechtia sp. TaxID=3101272 RepID=UPI003A6D353D|nr:MAG: hypothetical protein QY305_14505 [Candidatus Jettenia sp. AMX2]